MTAVDNIAWIIIIAAVIKMVVLLVNPKAWMGFASKIWKNKSMMTGVSLILSAVVLYYLLQEITIVQILASMAFMGLLLAVGLAPHIDSLFHKYAAQIKKGKLWKENWLYTLIWIVLLIWGIKELLGS